MASKKSRYRVVARHAITDDRGRQFGPGETITDLDSSSSERLLEAGSIVAVNAPAKRKTPTKSTGKDEASDE